MVNKALALIVYLSLPLCLFSQQTASIMDQVLAISVEAGVSNENAEKLWGMEHNTLTISGRSVSIRLEGANIEIYSYLTPFDQNDGNVLLVAHGEIIVQNPETGEKKHYSGMDSITVGFGEKALFFPLGLADPSVRRGLILKIEITVDFYTNLQKKSTKR
ncbi:MAG: hypothetical protein JXB03_08750 [Spirochaetales bacterium]|nr:hypothetical protein [Spirochaetales bacterium]